MTSTSSVESTSLAPAAVEGVLVRTDSKGRLRVSKEQRKAVLAKFEQSGMSARQIRSGGGDQVLDFRRLGAAVSANQTQGRSAALAPAGSGGGPGPSGGADLRAGPQRAFARAGPDRVVFFGPGTVDG